jgi:hypothetical protein
MSQNLNVAAVAAQLAEQDRKKIEAYQKALSVHKNLNKLPTDLAREQAAKLPPGQLRSLETTFGNEDPAVTPKRSPLETAWHYTGGYVGRTLAAGLAGLQNVSDFTTRVYRTAAIAAQEDLSLEDAWEEANDKGDKKFNSDRIEDARLKYGNDAVTVAMRIAAGEDQGKILKEATEGQKKYVQFVSNKAGTQEERDLFQDTIDAVNRAKYSPGRQVANFLLPEFLEENGFAYKAISGTIDAAYRVFADPLIVGGKIKKLYDINKYSLEVIIGSAAKDGVAFNRYFNQTKTINFWNDYGAKLKAYRETTNPIEKVAINKELARLAPEFGDEVIKSFNKAGVEDVLTARALFDNAQDLQAAIKNAGARRRVIAPRMTAGRKTRVAFLTATNKVFDIDKVGPSLVNSQFFGEEATDAGIIKILGKDNIAKNLEYIGDIKKTKGVSIFRFSTDSIGVRIDRMKQRFTVLPMFKNNEFDVTAPDAAQSIYRLARLSLPQRDSKLAAEVFKNIEDVGQRKEFFYGLWDNIANIRGWDTSKPLKNMKKPMVGKANKQYDQADGLMSDVGAFASDFNNSVYVPSLRDLDRASARSTLGQKIIGIPANDAFLEKMVTGWSFLTLAGPRYALRNSIEDLMVNLAIGQTPWGLASSRRLTTRVLTGVKQTEVAGSLGKRYEGLANSPLGFVMRILNKEESAVIAKKIADLDTAIVATKESTKKIQAVIDKSTNPKQITALKIKIAKLEGKQKTDLVKEARGIMASTLTQGRLNRFRKSLGMKPMNQEAIDFLSEQIVYGDIENLLSVVSEGGLNFATGASFLTDAVEFTRSHGVRSEQLRLIAPKALYTRAAGRGFEDVLVDPTNEASLVTWLLRISYASNDELGSLAVAYLDDEAEAVAQILNALKKNPKLVDDSILKARGISPEEHARMVYARTRRIFETRTKELNTELLDKVRTIDAKGVALTGNKKTYKVAGQISLDDLPTDYNLTPRSVVGPTLVPVTDTGNYAANIMENGWRWLGASNARISRQPIAINELLTIRRQMRKSGFEDAWINSYTKGITPNTEAFTEAIELAKRDLARVAEERAIGQTLPYLDNPLIRSQIAFSSRNFARFYRATEDFYRRITRAVRYNPESIALAALTYEGITHSGFVQEDDQGEPYFIYPAIAPIYNAYQKMLNVVGLGSEFKVPFPVQFGAQVKMLTPSLNPDSLVPTFAGPVAGISIRTLESIVNIWSPSAADTITRYTLGKYAVDQPILSSFLPAHINRAYSAMNKDERDGQYASAHRKAVTYLESAGYTPKGKIDPITNKLMPPSEAELEEYRLRIKQTTMNILGMRFVFGFFAPASPQVQLKSDMAEWMRDSGRANFKQVWNDLRDEYKGDYEGAMKRWVELYPDQIAFTISESERTTVSKFAYAEESGNFVDQNQELFKKYKQGATFLIPNKSGFSWDAYKNMTDMGLRKNLRVDEHLKKVQTAADVQTYYERKNEYEKSLERYRTDYERSRLRREFTQWKDLFFAGHPLVAEYLSQGSQIAIDRQNALRDLEFMLRDESVRAARPKTFDALKAMLNTYLDYKTQRDRYESIGTPRDLQRSLKERTIVRMRQLSLYNENTLQAYDSLFGGLLDD